MGYHLSTPLSHFVKLICQNTAMGLNSSVQERPTSATIGRIPSAQPRWTCASCRTNRNATSTGCWECPRAPVAPKSCPPAVGWPAFFTLGVIYFSMNYLLLGALFLSIGAQASTAREVQILSMPVTFAQVLIFGFAAIAIGAPNSPGALFAAAFPLSSPLVMLARAAEDGGLWPHALALAWQALWVGIILAVGAHLFRRRILQSGPRTGRWFKRAEKSSKVPA